MDKNENDLEKIEEKINCDIESVDIANSSDYLRKIKPKLKPKKGKSIKYSLFNIIYPLSATVCIAAIIGIGLFIGLPHNIPDENPPDYGYGSDGGIATRLCDREYAESLNNMYIPNFEILLNGELTESYIKDTSETIKFNIMGMLIDEYGVQDISLAIYVKDDYVVPSEWRYNSGEIYQIAKYAASIYYSGFEESYYCYNVGIVIDSLRYYLDYRTTFNDIDIALSSLTVFFG